jgi:4-diphosphocytidyl-2-C-methyl-D-erythritol kinase
MVTAALPFSGVRVSNGSVCCYAPAKLNLALLVGDRRADGFHEIDSIMAAVDLFDRVTVSHSNRAGVEIRCNWPNIPTNGKNLVCRAIALLASEAELESAVSVELTKSIPVGRGLGGGSSDAASALKAANELWGLNWSDDRLASLGGRIGSDVPFFFHTPFARCQGRGEIVFPVPPPVNLFATIAIPEFGISTADVYRIHARNGSGRGASRVDSLGDWTFNSGMETLINMLEPSAVEAAPRLGPLWRNIEKLSGRRFRLTGSGSALFTLHDDGSDAEAVAGALKTALPVQAEAVQLCSW